MYIRAVFFDIDGTLVDSNDKHVLAWEEAFANIGVHIDRARIHEQIGKGTDMLVPALLPDADPMTTEELGDAHGKIFTAKYLDSVVPFAASRDLLAHAHAAGQRVVLASSAQSNELEHYLSLLDAHHLVAATTCSDDVENTKPAPDIFATALEKVAPLVAQEVIVVGDTPYDVEAAVKCGMAAIALRSGKFSDTALSQAGAVAIYDDAAALLADYANSPLGR